MLGKRSHLPKMNNEPEKKGRTFNGAWFAVGVVIGVAIGAGIGLSLAFTIPQKK
jgi:hypothetical protein